MVQHTPSYAIVSSASITPTPLTSTNPPTCSPHTAPKLRASSTLLFQIFVLLSPEMSPRIQILLKNPTRRFLSCWSENSHRLAHSYYSSLRNALMKSKYPDFFFTTTGRYISDDRGVMNVARQFLFMFLFALWLASRLLLLLSMNLHNSEQHEPISSDINPARCATRCEYRSAKCL